MMETGSDPSRRRWAAMLFGLVMVAVVGVVTSEPSRSPPTSAAPLSAPDEPNGGTALSSLPMPQPDDAWVLGLQSRSELQWLDPISGGPVAKVEGLIDAIRRGDEVFGRRPGELVVVRRDGAFDVFEVADQQFVDWVTPNPTMDLTPRPVALIPTVALDGEPGDQDLILTRVAIDGSEWSDIPLPGCGFGYPIAAQSSDRVFAMWCGGSDDLRVFVDDVGELTEERFVDLADEGSSPSILDRGDKPILIDAEGRIWTLVLSSQPSLDVIGDLDLDDGASHRGIAALTEDFRIAIVGVTRSDELPGFGGRVTAGRLVGFDLVLGRIIWDEVLPKSIESLVAAPDGFVYGYRSHPEMSGGDLFAIDPATGETTVRATGLSSEPGRLLVTSTKAVTSANRTSATALDTPDEGPLFGVGIYTNALVLFDNGLEGILALEPDARLYFRSTVEGQRAGDEPYSMVRVGDSLVVGWGEVFAVDIITRDPTSIGLATIFIPAAEPDRVWMIDWPGGAVGLGTPTVWQVATTGELLTDPMTLDIDGLPAHGIPGGLAVQTNEGIRLWDAKSQESRLLPVESGNGYVFDASDNDLVWCRADCSELVVTDLSTMMSEGFVVPDGFTLITHSSFRGQHLSPDGRFVATLIRRIDSVETSLWLIELATGDTVAFSDAAPVDFLAWGPDGNQIFATSDSYGLAETIVWRYDLQTGHFASVTLPFGGALTPIALNDTLADSYIIGEPGYLTDCPPQAAIPAQSGAACVRR